MPSDPLTLARSCFVLPPLIYFLPSAIPLEMKCGYRVALIATSTSTVEVTQLEEETVSLIGVSLTKCQPSNSKYRAWHDQISGSVCKSPLFCDWLYPGYKPVTMLNSIYFLSVCKYLQIIEAVNH